MSTKRVVGRCASPSWCRTYLKLNGKCGGDAVGEAGHGAVSVAQFFADHTGLSHSPEGTTNQRPLVIASLQLHPPKAWRIPPEDAQTD